MGWRTVQNPWNLEVETRKVILQLNFKGLMPAKTSSSRGFHKWWYPKRYNGKSQSKMDLFGGTSISGHLHLVVYRYLGRLAIGVSGRHLQLADPSLRRDPEVTRGEPPIFGGLYQQFVGKLGMVYCGFTHIIRLDVFKIMAYIVYAGWSSQIWLAMGKLKPPTIQYIYIYGGYTPEMKHGTQEKTIWKMMFVLMDITIVWGE